MVIKNEISSFFHIDFWGLSSRYICSSKYFQKKNICSFLATFNVSKKKTFSWNSSMSSQFDKNNTRQGSYWVANTFIWSWLLLPILPLSDLIKQDVAVNLKNEAGQQPYWLKLTPYTAFTLLTLLAWLATYPGWRYFFEFNAVLLLLPSSGLKGIFG